ncbi:MAG: hypothetical protein ACFB50_04625 [Rubrobacteraceae bacterium]
MAQEIAVEEPGFFDVTGPGEGNKKTNAFMRKLQRRAKGEFSTDLSEQEICGHTKFAVDFYFKEEATIVEVALSLKNPNTEFEKDILKALMAQERNFAVTKLLFLSKPGAIKRHESPSSRDIVEWVKRNHGIQVEVKELVPE